MSGMEYDVSSPFPPSAEQLHFSGQILGNSIAALFAQQSPSPEISYAAVVAEQLRVYTRPLIDYTLHQFRLECCSKLYGDLSFGKAAANKALDTLDKILILNNHYQLMWDFDVWDIFHPPSIIELKQLSAGIHCQPVSALLKKEIDNSKKQIYAHIESIILYRKSNPRSMEGIIHDEDCTSSMNEGSSPRYGYPPCEKYYRLENNLAFNVIEGRLDESPKAKDFKICTNELIAFQINKEAKFNKVYRENSNECFLMPAEFKNQAMRNFFRLKFEQFNNIFGHEMKDADAFGKILEDSRVSMREELDFALEHSERQRVEVEYLTANGVAVEDESKGEMRAPFFQYETQSNSESLPTTSIPAGNEDAGRNNLSDFDAEFERARKHFLDSRDVLIKDWELRDNTQGLLEKLGMTVEKLIKGEHVACQCGKQTTSCNKLREQFDHSLKMLRQANEDLSEGLSISQILKNILVKLDYISKRFGECVSLVKSKVDQQNVI